MTDVGTDGGSAGAGGTAGRRRTAARSEDDCDPIVAAAGPDKGTGAAFGGRTPGAPAKAGERPAAGWGEDGFWVALAMVEADSLSATKNSSKLIHWSW